VTQYTGEDGSTTFGGLLPGTYTVTEIVPTTGGWVALGDTSATVTIQSSLDGSVVAGTSAAVAFANACIVQADGFGTKGYWHNKNGLSELLPADIEYVNGLLPYSAPSGYFGAGDEPFDGQFADGTPVDASKGILGDELAPAGSVNAEVSQFLVDPNAGGDPREQLAQQLLAFIFNVRHRLGVTGEDLDAVIVVLDESGNVIETISAQGLILAAIDAWAQGDAAAQTEIATVLDEFNNSTGLLFIPSVAPEPVY